MNRIALLSSVAAVGLMAASSCEAQSPGSCAYIGANCYPDRSGDAVVLSGTPQKIGDAFGSLYARAGDVPVCSGGWFPGEGGTATSTGAVLQGGTRKLMYCPNGIKSGLKFLFASAYALPTETDNTTALPVNIGVEFNASAPWSSTTSYAAGQIVVYGRSLYTALAASTGVMPGPASTATWTATGLPTPTPVTCGGQRTCQMPTVTTPSGATVTQASLTTDTVSGPVVPPGGLIAVDIWTNQASGNNAIPVSPYVNVLSGEYYQFGPGIGDRSTTASFPGSSNLVAAFTPVAAIGQPVKPGPTACVAADSSGAGVIGNGVAGLGTLAGGSGFVANDVGQRGTISNTGASAGAVNASAQVRIEAVSGGAITQVSLIDSGSYTNSTTQPSQTLPSGAQTLFFPGAAGTGASVASVTLGSSHESMGPNTAQGWLQRGHTLAGIPSVMFARSSDSIASWLTRDYTRLNMIGRTGCSTVVVELGGNDQTLPLATEIANAKALSAQFHAIPTVKTVLWVTPTNQIVVSTDGFVTTAGQTVNGLNATNVAPFNDAIRAGGVGADDYIEVNDAQSTARNSGILKVDGTVCSSSCDGLHPSQAAQPALAAYVAPQLAAKAR